MQSFVLQMLRFSAKRMLAVWIWPILATTFIISDWYNVKKLRADGYTTVIDAMRDDNKRE